MISTKEKYELYKPKKFLGQNFLVDENIAKKIVASLEIKPNDNVIEIGPGRGVLTKIISEQTKNFYAVELDKQIHADLSGIYKDKVNLIHKDFLDFDFDKDIPEFKEKLKIIGNIPYNITTEILFKFFKTSNKIDVAILMMQKEVAQRLVSQPNSKSYGILAIQTQLHTTPKVLFNVPPTAFFPKPAVNSSVVRFKFDKDISNVNDIHLFTALVRESFGQRRKTMKNSLKKYFEGRNILFDQIKFDFSRRPESVSIEEFKKLANDVSIKTV